MHFRRDDLLVDRCRQDLLIKGLESIDDQLTEMEKTRMSAMERLERLPLLRFHSELLLVVGDDRLHARCARLISRLQSLVGQGEEMA